MKELSINAQECLNSYLEKVKARLRGAKSLDANEIERDIHEHIERELESEAEPIGYEAVAEVLGRLGSPEQWVPDEELSWWRKILARLQNGPDDWRLAYICFGIFVLSILTLPFGLIFFLPLSFYIARSMLSGAGGPEELGSQKKLIYPPLIAVYAAMGLALLLCTLPLIGIADGLEREFVGTGHELKLFQDDMPYWFMAWGLILAATGLWWIILSVILCNQHMVNWLIYPFGGFITKRKRWVLLCAGLLLIFAGIAICCIMIRRYSNLVAL